MFRFQFRVLYRIFLMRAVDLEVLSADGDPAKLLGQIAALLAGVSLLFCLPLLLAGGGWHETDLWVMEHLFIAATMLAIGLFSVLSWDSIFPDRRDLLVLAPLPVAPRTIFAAKLAALCSALCLSVLALNVFTGLLWPLYFSSGNWSSVLRAFGAYWTTISAAAAFMFFLVLTVQGLATQLLPRQLLLRVAAPLQVTAFCLFLGTFILEPIGVTEKLLTEQTIRWLPSYWFFGLFQQLNASSGPVKPVFTELAHQAWFALAVAVSGSVATLLLSYFHTLRTIVEAPEIVPGKIQIRWPIALGGSISAAITRFCFRTMLRSRSHRVLLSFYFGVGFAIVLAYVAALLAGVSFHRSATAESGGNALLAASMLMMCAAVGGIRIVASVPVALRANWIFRVTELYPPAVYLGAVRSAFGVLGALPVWLASAGVFLFLWPFGAALEHLLVLGLLGAILIEALLGGSKKIPFTCSYLPGKGNLQYLFWACALLLLPAINAGAQFEMQILARPIGYCALILMLGITLAMLRWRTTAFLRTTARMCFDEVNAPELLSLSLGRE